MKHLRLVPGSENNNNSIPDGDGPNHYDQSKKVHDAEFVYSVVKQNAGQSVRELAKIGNIEAGFDETTFKNRFYDLKKLGYIVEFGDKICSVSGKKVTKTKVSETLPFSVNTYKLNLKKANEKSASVRNHDEVVADILKFVTKLTNYAIPISLKLSLTEELNILLKQVTIDIEENKTTKRGWKSRKEEALASIKALAKQYQSILEEEKKAA